VLTFDPPLSVSEGQAASFTLELTRAQGTGGASALPPIVAEGSKPDGTGMTVAAVGASLSILSLVGAARRRWLAGALLGVAALVTLGVVGCGGGGSTSTGSPLSASAVVASTASTVVIASVEGKIPSGGAMTYANLPLALPPVQVQVAVER
jgi:hypothetical protein